MTDYDILHECETCLCGNNEMGEGFFPCDEHGNEIEPTVESDWTNLMVCGRCGKIYKLD